MLGHTKQTDNKGTSYWNNVTHLGFATKHLSGDRHAFSQLDQ